MIQRHRVSGFRGRTIRTLQFATVHIYPNTLGICLHGCDERPCGVQGNMGIRIQRKCRESPVEV